MNKEFGQQNLNFQVVCSWCGHLIRRTSAKDSHGMCLKCYARMLQEHNRSPAREGQAPRRSSDR
ncbi:MAG TPA: hypothetical protein VGB17_19375 [Pyrinomonadaceae bacterium]